MAAGRSPGSCHQKLVVCISISGRWMLPAPTFSWVPSLIFL